MITTIIILNYLGITAWACSEEEEKTTEKPVSHKHADARDRAHTMHTHIHANICACILTSLSISPHLVLDTPGN